MRSVFSSQRVETAEGVARLLRDNGIEVHVSNGQSYRTRRSGQFSYLEQSKPKDWPTVWVVRADEQVRAREILRGANLLDTTRRNPGAAATYSFAEITPREAKPDKTWSWRIRVALLVVISGVALFIVLRRPSLPPPAPATPVPALQPPADDGVGEDEIRIRLVPASD